MSANPSFESTVRSYPHSLSSSPHGETKATQLTSSRQEDDGSNARETLTSQGSEISDQQAPIRRLQIKIGGQDAVIIFLDRDLLNDVPAAYATEYEKWLSSVSGLEIRTIDDLPAAVSQKTGGKLLFRKDVGLTRALEARAKKGPGGRGGGGGDLVSAGVDYVTDLPWFAGLSTGAKAGFCVGVIVGGLVVCFGLFWSALEVARWNDKRKETAQGEEDVELGQRDSIEPAGDNGSSAAGAETRLQTIDSSPL